MKTLDASDGEPQTGKSYTGLHYFLPRGIVDIAGTVAASGGSYNVTISRHNEADRSHRLRLVQCSSPMYDDATTLVVDDQGLLTDKQDISSTDRTSDVINNLADTTINVAKIAANAEGMLAATAPGATPPPPPPKPFSVSFDPLIPSEVKDAIKAVKAAGFTLTVTPPTGLDATDKASVLNESQQISGPLARTGIFYRPLTTVKIGLTCTADAQIVVHKNLPIPDPRAVAVFDLHRAWLVKKETGLTFAGGEPRTLNHTKPSEALAASQIPLNVTNKVVNALPSIGNLLWPKPQTAVQELQARTALSQAQANLAAQQLATLQAQQSLKAAQKGAAQPGSAANPVPAAAAASAMTSSTAVSAATQAKINDLQTQLDTQAAQLKKAQENQPVFPALPATPGVPPTP